MTDKSVFFIGLSTSMKVYQNKQTGNTCSDQGNSNVQTFGQIHLFLMIMQSFLPI